MASDYTKLGTLAYLVEEWARMRGLLTADVQPEKQMLKLVEEVGETAKAVAYRDKWTLADGIGDCMVCLIVLAKQNDLDIEHCLEVAYEEIKDRKGVLEDGLFKKDS
jgi:phosphoribosyl-ATP pyrophosphohydrolase|tara:strand:+ start:1326 stop:1646 length:321 start_codon:yes stop_codon:yes gene_type:complete